MASATPAATWRVLPHDAIETLEDNLWTVEGSLPNNSGLKRRMTVMRARDNALCIHNGIALGAADMQRLEAFGRPSLLIVPNGLHRLDAARFAARYPGLKVYCPQKSASRVQQVVPQVAFYEAMPAFDNLQIVPLRGLKNGEAALVFSHGSATTLILNDAMFNMPHGTGVGGFIMRMLGSSGGPRVTPVARLLMVADKAALAEHLRQLADTRGLKRIIVSHGDIVSKGAPQVLRDVAGALAG